MNDVGHRFDPSILREYDIRGLVGKTLTARDAHMIGRVFGSVIAKKGGKRLYVGRDGRLHSPELEYALVEGLMACGLEAVRIAHVKPLGLQSVEHCEIHAREVGLEARVFDNETNARLWLRYGSA